MADFPQAPAWASILTRPIAFHPIFADLTGSVKAAIMLSQAFYWQSRNETGGWWFKTQQAWWHETRLSRREQDSARKILRDLGFMQEKRSGVPAKLYFWVDYEAIGAEISSLHKSAKLSMAESANLRVAITANQDTTKPPITYESKDETKRVSNETPPDSDFSEFWGCWIIPGTKRSKAATKREYERIIKRREAEHAQLCHGARRYMRECQGAARELRFIKHPSTWLSAGCWDDDPTPSNGSAKPQRKRRNLLDESPAVQSDLDPGNPESERSYQ